MDKNIIPVVWGLDEKYVLPAFVVMHSILAHSDEKYCFYILTADHITEQVQEYASLLNDRYDNFDLSVKMVDKNLFAGARIHNQHLSIAAYFRLLIPELITEYEKCIYLDCDILVNDDLAELFGYDLGDCYLAGVKDCHIIEDTPREREHEKILGIPSRDKYINSGVLLLNLKKIREDGLAEKFLAQMCRENWYEDQDVLNYCCYPHIKILPLKYNLFHLYYGKSIKFLYYLGYQKQEFDFDEPFIIHMGAKYKPWIDIRVKCADKWWKLAEIFQDTHYYQIYLKQSRCKEDIDIMFEAIEENRNKQFVVCGYSQNGRRLYDMLYAKGYSNIVAISDNNREKCGEIYRGIPVMEMDRVVEKYRDIFWIVSVQAAFEEVRQQILGLGFDDHDIVRYINNYDDKFYLLSLDCKYYDSEISKIAMFEYTEEITEYDRRKEYILNILKNPEFLPEEYEYLNDKYHFDYWYNL